MIIRGIGIADACWLKPARLYVHVIFIDVTAVTVDNTFVPLVDDLEV